MIEYPWACCQCEALNMVNLLDLDIVDVNKTVKAKGFTCGCGTWNTLFYSTLLLELAFLKLETLDIHRKDFMFHFGKALKKSDGIRQKMESYPTGVG